MFKGEGQEYIIRLIRFNIEILPDVQLLKAIIASYSAVKGRSLYYN